MEERKPDCYHASCMWSADGCCNCKYDMDCYKHWLEHMMKGNEHKWKTMDQH